MRRFSKNESAALVIAHIHLLSRLAGDPANPLAQIDAAPHIHGVVMLLRQVVSDHLAGISKSGGHGLTPACPHIFSTTQP